MLKAMGSSGFALFPVMIPFLIHQATLQSKARRAAWIFYAALIDRVRMVLAVKRIIILLRIFPIAPFLIGVQAWIFGSFLHAGLLTAGLIPLQNERILKKISRWELLS